MLPTSRAEQVADPGQHVDLAGQDLGIAPQAQGAVGQAALRVGGAVADTPCRCFGRHQREVGVPRRTGIDSGRPWAQDEVVRGGCPTIVDDLLFDHHGMIRSVGQFLSTPSNGVEARDPLRAEEVGHVRIVPTRPLCPTVAVHRTIPAVPAPNPASRVAPIPASLQSLGRHVDDRILTLLDAEFTRWSAVDPELGEPLGALRALIAAGGKRLRPAFCHWAFVGSGGDPDDPRVVDAGAALELLHTFALVHDDVMDGSDQRRGLPSVHRRFVDRHVGLDWRTEARRSGEGAAILVGDFAFVYADILLGDIPATARSVFDELRIELCVGQYLDLVGTASGSRDPVQATRIERYKSGKYTVERPLHLGAALAGAGPAVLDAWSAVGLPLGEAFQLRDDLLGVFGNTSITGKPVGDDLREGKLTPLVAAAAARADESGRALLERLGAPDLTTDEIASVQELLLDCGACDEIEATIAARVDAALHALDAAPIRDDARDQMAELARFAAWRDR